MKLKHSLIRVYADILYSTKGGIANSFRSLSPAAKNGIFAIDKSHIIVTNSEMERATLLKTYIINDEQRMRALIGENVYYPKNESRAFGGTLKSKNAVRPASRPEDVVNDTETNLNTLQRDAEKNGCEPRESYLLFEDGSSDQTKKQPSIRSLGRKKTIGRKNTNVNISDVKLCE